MITDKHYKEMVSFRIRAFADMAKEIAENPLLDNLTFSEKIERCIEAECLSRQNRKTARYNRSARFANPEACVEDIEYLPGRSINRESIERLATCSFIADRRNVILISATGGGKSYISQALGNLACRSGHTVRYIRQADLARELDIARRNGELYECMDAFKEVDLLILDDLFLTETPMQAVNDLLEIIEARKGKGALLLASQLTPEEWHLRIDTKIVADALLDRMVHNSYII